jgi:hypothetical protein
MEKHLMNPTVRKFPMLAPTLKEAGFTHAAERLPHWEHDPRTLRAWTLYTESAGNMFLDLTGKTFTAPKILLTKREFTGALPS